MKYITKEQLRNAKIVVATDKDMIGLIRNTPYAFHLLKNGGVIVYKNEKQFGYAVPPKKLGDDNWSLVLDIINNDIKSHAEK